MGGHKSIKRQNLFLLKQHTPDAGEKASLEQIQAYLHDDPAGQLFYNRVLVSMNMGLTNLTDPTILPAFEKLVGMRLGEVLLQSPPQQRQWEALLRLTKHPSWCEFRELVQKMRS